jgi:hypothetical protein
MIKILHNYALFGVKNAIFSAEFFGKISKNHNTGHCPQRTVFKGLGRKSCLPCNG